MIHLRIINISNIGDFMKCGRVKLEDDLLRFYVPYNYDLNKDLKKAGAKWNSRKTCLEYSISYMLNYPEIIEIIEKYGILPYDSKTENTINTMKKEIELLSHKYALSHATEPTRNVNIKLPAGRELYEFQKAGIQYIMKSGGRALVADEMGLGKTIQSLVYLYNHPEFEPTLIICPASLKINWKREIKEWTGKDACIISSRGEISEGYSYYVINYDILSKKLKKLSNMNFKSLVIDEAHYIKNYKAKRTKATLELSRTVRDLGGPVLALTGTPIVNRPAELFPLLVALGIADKWQFWSYYAYAYCDPRKIRVRGRSVTIANGESNLEELNRKLRGLVMVRRLKKDVLSQLPPKRKIVIPLEIENRKEYDYVERAFIEWYREKGMEVDDNAQLLQKIEALRKMALVGKLSQTVEFIMDTYENRKKVVVFTHHRSILQRIYTELQKGGVNTSMIIGGMSVEKKQKTVDWFNNSDNAIILISVRAGGEGINLQSSHVAIFVELDWTPAMVQQAEDRIHRIGQEQAVDIYYLIAERTVEESLLKVIQNKSKMIDKALNNKISVLNELIENLLE